MKRDGVVLEDRLGLDELLSDHFLRELHRRLYGDIWIWAGVHRHYLFNLGVDPAYIAIELRASIDTIRYRWEHTKDWTARELGTTRKCLLTGRRHTPRMIWWPLRKRMLRMQHAIERVIAATG